MDKQLVLMMILFAYILLKGFVAAIYESQWTGVKVRKFYLYIGINVVLSIAMLFFYMKYAVSQTGFSINSDVSANTAFTYSDLFNYIASYLLCALALFLSLKSWPFAKPKAASFKTLLAVVFVILLVQLAASLTLPVSSPSYPLS